MQKYGEKYGFWLTSFKNSDETSYQEIKAGIELVCQTALRCANILKISDASFCYTFKIKPSGTLYLTVCIYSGITLFGVYDYNENKILNNIDISDFEGFGYREFDFFATRCSELLFDKSQGKAVESERLVEAWNNYIIKHFDFIDKIKEAKTDNTVFLEQKDLLERE